MHHSFLEEKGGDQKKENNDHGNLDKLLIAKDISFHLVHDRDHNQTYHPKNGLIDHISC